MSGKGAGFGPAGTVFWQEQAAALLRCRQLSAGAPSQKRTGLAVPEKMRSRLGSMGAGFGRA